MIGLEEAITQAGRRLEVAWPARKWTADLRREYAEALRAIGDPEAIRDGTIAAVRGWGGDFPPPIGSLCEVVWEEQRKRLVAQRERIAEQERRSGEDYEVAPAWWARLVMGALMHSMHSRGNDSRTPPRTLPYEAICERHGVTPQDIGEKLDGSDSPAHARRAIAEAKAYGERKGDDVPSSFRELGDLGAGFSQVAA